MRNYNVEKTAGRGNLALRMVEVKEARHEASTMELMLIAQIMVFCGLPYQKTEAREITRRARMADGDFVTVTFKVEVHNVFSLFVFLRLGLRVAVEVDLRHAGGHPTTL